MPRAHRPDSRSYFTVTRGLKLPDPPKRLADLDPEARAWVVENDRYVQAGAGRSRKMRLCMAIMEDGRACPRNASASRKNFCRDHHEENSGSIPPTSGGKKGQKNWRRQFTSQEVKRIRDQYAEGNNTIRALGKKWGASEGVISHIIHYRTYRQGTSAQNDDKKW